MKRRIIIVSEARALHWVELVHMHFVVMHLLVLLVLLLLLLQLLLLLLLLLLMLLLLLLLWLRCCNEVGVDGCSIDAASVGLRLELLL